MGKAQKDEPQYGARILLRLEARVGAKLVGSVPQAFFQRGVGGVFFSWGNPEHEEMGFDVLLNGLQGLHGRNRGHYPTSIFATHFQKKIWQPSGSHLAAIWLR